MGGYVSRIPQQEKVGSCVITSAACLGCSDGFLISENGANVAFSQKTKSGKSSLPLKGTLGKGSSRPGERDQEPYEAMLTVDSLFEKINFRKVPGIISTQDPSP